MALITVITPCYNMGRFLGQALESLLAQSHEEFEAFVVDDGSTDDSAQVAARYLPGGEQGDERIHYIHQKNQGKLAALNAALKASKGELVCILDADDTMPPQGLELRAKALEDNPQAVAVYADADYMDIDGNVYRTRRSRPFRRKWELAASPIVPVIGASLMVRRRVFDDIGPLDTSFVRSDDAYLNLEVDLRGQMIYLPQVVLNYRNYPRTHNLRLRLITIYHDCRLILRHYNLLLVLPLMALKAGTGLMKFAYEVVSPKK